MEYGFYPLTNANKKLQNKLTISYNTVKYTTETNQK